MPTTDEDSILNNTKKVLGIPAEYPQFDLDITLHINSVFSTLYQLGVGPQDDQFLITGTDETWADFIGTQKNVNMVKSYIYLRVRLLFDPPASGFGLTSIQEQIKEFEWRMNVAQSSSPNVETINY